MAWKSTTWILLVALIAIPISTNAGTIVFSDNFDAQAGTGDGASGGSSIAHGSFSNWTVSSGSVDLIQHGDFGISCAGGSGKCVDLDGATSDAGILASKQILLAPGTYELSYMLGGVEAAFGGDGPASPNVVDVTVGSLFTQEVTRNQGDPFTKSGGQFTVAQSTNAQISFANRGGDNFGAMLDDVVLSFVPEPGAVSLFAVGLLALSIARQRHSTNRR